MARVHAEGRTAYLGEPSARLDPHGMRLDVVMLRTVIISDVLDQRAAAEDVEHLQPAADREHGLALRERARKQLIQLECVPRSVGLFRARNVLLVSLPAGGPAPREAEGSAHSG